MPDDKILKVNPIIEKLSEVAGRDSAVELQGYVGPSEPDVVRLYKSLSMTHYVEVPKDSILHAVEAKDDDAGQVKLYVAGSTQVLRASIKYTRRRAEEFDRPLPRPVPFMDWGQIADPLCDRLYAAQGLLEYILYWLEKTTRTGNVILAHTN